jgi:hypothetical protein
MMWWIREGFVRKGTRQLVDNTATAEAMAGLPKARQRYVTKSALSNCGVGMTLVKWNYQTEARCS